VQTKSNEHCQLLRKAEIVVGCIGELW